MDKKISRLENLFSRKFLISLSCVLGGITLIKSGSFLPGFATLVTACTGYLVAEGLIDIKNIEKITALYKGSEVSVKEEVSELKDFDL